MTTLEVLVRLAAQDPWSFTVFDTLKRKEGIGEIVAITRLKSWRLRFDAGSPGEALRTTEHLLAETALLVNPNRDLWAVRAGQATGLPEALWKREADARDAFVVRVTDKEDLAAKSLLRVLRSRLGLREIHGAQFGSVWVLETDVGEPRSRAIAQEVAVSRTWRSGLLSNSHFQDAKVFRVDEYGFQDEAET